MVVSDPEVNDHQRFPLVGVVPITRTPGEGALYPVLGPGTSGLLDTSCALADHVRSIDKRRISRVYGTLTRAEMDAVDEGLALFFGLAARTGDAWRDCRRS